jgi:hypothetical protein
MVTIAAMCLCMAVHKILAEGSTGMGPVPTKINEALRRAVADGVPYRVVLPAAKAADDGRRA